MNIPKETFDLDGIPAILYGMSNQKVWLFLHGKCGFKEEAESFARIACAAGDQVLSIDLPEHGVRNAMQDAFNPWVIVPELQFVMSFMQARWSDISLRANSIGAYFSMLAFSGFPFRKALFVSPVLDMEQLISDMMMWAQVSESDLLKKQEITTNFGETLSWRYLTWVRDHPIDNWNCPTAILYAGQDNLTSRKTVDTFVRKHQASLTVMEDGEHWFHTPQQLNVMASWEQNNI